MNKPSPSACSISAYIIPTVLACIRSSLWLHADRDQPPALAMWWDISLAEVLQFCAALLRSRGLHSATQPIPGLDPHFQRCIWIFLPLRDILSLPVLCVTLSGCNDSWWSSSGYQHCTLVISCRNIIRNNIYIEHLWLPISQQEHRDHILQSHS